MANPRSDGSLQVRLNRSLNIAAHISLVLIARLFCAGVD
jgi:hypothetical protein